MKVCIRILIVIIASSILALPGKPAHTASLTIQSDPPYFTPAPCMFDVESYLLENVDIQCGYLTVPQEYQASNGKTIQLAVAILKSPDPNPKADPVVFLQGGPGGSTIDTYVQAFLLGERRLLTDRDIILFDQRGTLYSKPVLYCTEFEQLIQNTLEVRLDEDQAWQMERQATEACRQRLENQGIDLSAYNSLENANDIHSLAQALGHSSINLYGVSYGTLLALHTMREHPDILRSVILDAVVPPQMNYILDVAQHADRAFNLLFETCSADIDCQTTYPDLENVYLEVYNMLEENPARFTMTDPETGITYNAVFDGGDFHDGIFQLLYATSVIPALPRVIYDARAGQFDFFARYMEIVLFDRSVSYGMYYSVLCAEDADFDLSTYDVSGLLEPVAKEEKDTPAHFLDACQIWNVNPLEEDIDDPVQSTIPTLILSGYLDPITPPLYAEAAAKTLVNSFSYVFPAGGHGQAMEGDCQDSIILNFLENPQIAPDDSCISQIASPEFYTPATLVDIPVVIKLLNLETTAVLQLGLLATSQLFMLTAWLALPLAALARHNRRRRTRTLSALPGLDPPVGQPEISQGPTSGATYGESGMATRNTYPKTESVETVSPSVNAIIVRLADIQALVNNLLIVVFTIAFLATAFNMALDNDNRILLGINGSFRAWLVLPIISLFLTILMIYTTFLAWAKKHWSVWRRLYYSLLTICAITTITILALWGILAALF